MELKDPQNVLTMAAAEAAVRLSEALGNQPAHWTTWLANDRRPGRVTRLLPTEPGLGRPRYRVDRVEAFITAYQAKKTAAAEPRSQHFGAHISAVSQAEGASSPFILMVTISPLKTYQLSSAEARNLARRLLNAADDLDLSIVLGEFTQREEQ